jgi:hypothetical protein
MLSRSLGEQDVCGCVDNGMKLVHAMLKVLKNMNVAVANTVSM